MSEIRGPERQADTSCQDLLVALVDGPDGYRRILEATEEAVWLLDAGGTLRYVNSRLCEILDRSEEELVDHHYLEFVPAEDRLGAASGFSRRVMGRERRRDLRLERADGSTVWLRVSSSPLTTEDGIMIGALAMGADIEEERTIEAERLAQAERAFVLAEFSQSLATVGTDAAEVLRIITTRTSSLFDATIIIQVRDEAGHLRTVALEGPDREHAAAVRTVLEQGPEPAPESELGRAIAEGTTIVWNEATGHLLRDQVPDLPVLGSKMAPFHLLLVPMAIGSRQIGVLAMNRRKTRLPFSAEEVAMAEEIGNRAALAISQAQLFAELERRSAEAEEAATELRRTVALLGQALDDRQALANRLVEAQEEERRRIAGDIHDDSIQALAALGLRLQLLRRHLSEPGDLEMLEGVDAALIAATGRLRNLLFDLRPPALDVGLASALEGLGSQLMAPTGIGWRVDAQHRRDPPRDVGATLYRIAREALINAVNHAQATEVHVTLRDGGGGIFLVVHDDGRGFCDGHAPVPGHLGLVNMRDQAELAGGALVVRSGAGAGTTITAWIPCPAGDPGEIRVAATGARP